ncbi:hypothetical protein D3C74_458480 [compost metagenome]
MRILIDNRLRPGNADLAEAVHRMGTGILLGQATVQPDGFYNLLADSKQRVQGSHRLLKNHRHGIAADFAHFFFF